MNSKEKLDYVHGIAKKIQALDIKHPEAILLLGAFKHQEAGDKGTAGVSLVTGCPHGIYLALRNSAKQSAEFARIFKLAADNLDNPDAETLSDIDDEDMPDFIKDILKKSGGRVGAISYNHRTGKTKIHDLDRDEKIEAIKKRMKDHPDESLTDFLKREGVDIPVEIKSLIELLDTTGEMRKKLGKRG